MKIFVVCDKKYYPGQVIDMIRDQSENETMLNIFTEESHARNCYTMVLNKSDFQLLEVEITAKVLSELTDKRV